MGMSHGDCTAKIPLVLRRVLAMAAASKPGSSPTENTDDNHQLHTVWNRHQSSVVLGTGAL